jgi:hypothetical protein
MDDRAAGTARAADSGSPRDAQTVLSLAATRALQVLDDFRVPYEDRQSAEDSGPWHRLASTNAAAALYWYAGDDGAPGGYMLAGIPLWGRVLSDDVVSAHAARLGREWRPELPILQLDGEPHASVWRTPEGGTLLPFDPDELVANLRSERYLQLQRSGGASLRSGARRVYYGVRPLIPRAVQISLRRAFTRLQAQGAQAFPRWPAEPALHDLSSFVLACVADAAGQPVPYLKPWPNGREWALVLTHDVETAVGRDAIGRIRAVEESLGYRSSWNLVPERYTVDDALVADLSGSGNEVGVHGLRHDGRDIATLRTLQRRLPEMRKWAERWRAVGFRSPATHRRWEWMPMLGFEYDSSYPDTDPYEPIPGGCCSWLPFFNQDQVELPITLPQDHTLFTILRQDGRLWREKADFLRGREGMALVIVHPDYMLDEEPLQAYEQFLGAFRDDPTAWKALPREASDWWRRRHATSLQFVGGAWRPFGPAEGEARIGFISPREHTTEV